MKKKEIYFTFQPECSWIVYHATCNGNSTYLGARHQLMPEEPQQFIACVLNDRSYDGKTLSGSYEIDKKTCNLFEIEPSRVLEILKRVHEAFSEKPAEYYGIVK